MDLPQEKDMSVPPPINWLTKPPRIDQSHQATMANSSYSGTTANNDTPVNIRSAFNSMTNVSNNDPTYSPIDNASYTGFIYPDTPNSCAPTAEEPFNGVGLKLRDKTIGPMTPISSTYPQGFLLPDPNTAQSAPIVDSPDHQQYSSLELYYPAMPPFPNPPPGRLAVEFVKVNQDWARDVEKWISGFRRYLTDLQEIANVEAHIQSEVKFDWHLSQPLCVKLPGPLINQAQQILNNAMARGEAINAGEITHHGFDNFAGHGGIGSGFGSAQAPQMVQPPPASGFTPNGEVPQYYTPVPGSAPPGFYIPSGGKRVNPKSNESPTPAAKKGRPRGGTGARFSKTPKVRSHKTVAKGSGSTSVRTSRGRAKSTATTPQSAPARKRKAAGAVGDENDQGDVVLGEGAMGDGSTVNHGTIMVDTLGAATQALAIKTPRKTSTRGKRVKIEESN